MAFWIPILWAQLSCARLVCHPRSSESSTERNPESHKWLDDDRLLVVRWARYLEAACCKNY
eukprot:1768511-Amphidinium_carterae.1